MTTIEELAKEYANRHLDISEELGRYLVKSVFLDGAEYQREKQDKFTIAFCIWLADEQTNLDTTYKKEHFEELLEIYKKTL